MKIVAEAMDALRDAIVALDSAVNALTELESEMRIYNAAQQLPMLFPTVEYLYGASRSALARLETVLLGSLYDALTKLKRMRLIPPYEGNIDEYVKNLGNHVGDLIPELRRALDTSNPGAVNDVLQDLIREALPVLRRVMETLTSAMHDLARKAERLSLVT